MANINGNGDGTRLTNLFLGIASAVTIAGILGLVTFAWNSNATLNRIESRLDQQDRRDAEQDKWIDYFRHRLDDGRDGPTWRREDNGH